MFTRSSTIIAVVVAFAAPAAAQTTTSTAGAGKQIVVRGNPNRMVCRTEESTGSRLAPSTKRCMTAQQWAEIKQYDRAAVEQIQTQRYKNN